ncbi:Actin-binding Rho-activating protein Striated muscle activator of Rho-dependent signaling [Channa argus]|uniref:Actin-binding Rho-activating protein n=1 Tax=Channa argus TaxID=215402 RepID=A0A6G1QY70_CHAAH|nr:Actin-binding Rho-activating protein Striated muscle activator of Rho-dependent signaling [Channa argus]
MSGKQSSKASQRKPSTSKSIKKLRTVSMVCGLTGSWQKWAEENEKKQASEPSGWAPSSLGGPTETPKQWVPKKPPPAQSQPTGVSHNYATCPEKAATPHQVSQPASKTEDFKTSPESPVASRIKTIQVVKTVTSGVQEKGAGISLLTEKIKKESLPSGDEIDRLLKKKSSPTRRRKCSNMVSSLTKSWKQVEKEQKPGKDGGGRTCCVHNDDSVQKERLDVDNEEQTDSEVSEGDIEVGVKIKRPSVPWHKKEAEDANKINALSKKYSAVGNLKSRWQDWVAEHTVNQKLNPFSEYFDYDYSMSSRIQKGQEGYGHPKEGSKTAERAKRAEKHIHREIDDMCFVIRTMADPDPDGKTRITFGQLFDRYVRISDKVVGILMRARKHGKVAFEGEMLWQGRDDGVIITLLV